MQVKQSLIRKLKKITGPDHVQASPEDLVAYSYDGSMASGMPEAIVHPSTLKEVVAIVGEAAAENVPIVPRGAGTGLSGGSLAARGGIVLHFDRMNRLKKLDSRDMLAIAEPGVINWELKQVAAAAGLFYPPDPSSGRVCTLGGNVAENAGGPYGVKYGVTSDYVLGLEAVLSSGEVIRTGGNTRRNVAGYDLTSLLVGSEGTLAIVTEISLRLLTRPLDRSTVLLAFDELVAAGEAVVAIGEGGVVPAALEIIDRTAMACVEQYRPGSLSHDAAAALLLEVDGEPEGVVAQMERAVSICESAGGRVIKMARSPEETEELWGARRMVSAALGRMGPAKIGEDVSIPRSRVPEMINRIEEIAARHGLIIAVFGHAGDGNLHPNILTDRRDVRMMKKAEAAIAELFEAALDMGGTLSGEHGIGTAKAPFMRYAQTPMTLRAMKKIKQALDPAGIMNPGKIFDEDWTSS